MTAAERVEKNTFECHLVLFSVVLWFFGRNPDRLFIFHKKIFDKGESQKNQTSAIYYILINILYSTLMLIIGIYQMDCSKSS